MKAKSGSYRPLINSLFYFAFIWLAMQMLNSWPLFTDEIYPSFYRWFYPVYSRIFGWIPFSVGDWLYLILIVLLVWTIILGIRCFVLGQKWRGFRIFGRLVLSIGIFYLLFQLLWGFNYYKPEIINQFQTEKYTTDELKLIADDTFKKSLELREEVREDKKGIFDFNRNEFYRNLPHSLPTSAIELPYLKIPNGTRKKYSLFSVFMRYFGVAGYFNPFTNEAQITRLIPDTSKPFSMAHEQAHQMGYATENEANFIGYLTCATSDSKPLQYSANYKALKYVLREIYPYDSIFVRQKLDSFSPGMKRDLDYENAYYHKYSGAADRAFSALNNAYLKANNQKEGMESYNRFVELLAGYYRLKKKEEN